jgi:hypothetical protein
MHESDTVVRQNLVTLHRFVYLLSHLESTVFVASLYQEVEHVNFEVDAVF